MSDSFRPSWVRSDGSAAVEKPTALIALLVVLGVLAGGTGLLVGGGINDGARVAHGVLVGLAWAMPYFAGAVVSWYGATPWWYRLIRVLGYWGTVVAGWMLLAVPHLSFPFAPEGGRPRDLGSLYLTCLPLLVANVAVILLARSEELRFYREVSYSWWTWKWTAAGVVVYYLLTATL